VVDSVADGLPAASADKAQHPVYGEYYYAHDCGIAYERNDHWLAFFARIADAIIETFAPATVLDVGCAKGFLVEALRQRGVEAWGIDISDYAIGEVPEALQSFCAVSGAHEELPPGFPAQYDLVTCIEVLEHVPDEHLKHAIANLSRWADRVLFSSSPDDYAEVTHLNVHPSEYWVSRLASHGCVRDFDVDVSYLTSWAIAFKKVPATLASVAGNYERSYGLVLREAREARNTALQLETKLEQIEASDFPALEAEIRRLRDLVGHDEAGYTTMQRELWRLRDELLGLQGELGVARGARAATEANQISAENRASYLAERLSELDRAHQAVVTSRQFQAGRLIVGPLRRLRQLARGR
jgi:SAM-dependent methyltransferase